MDPLVLVYSGTQMEAEQVRQLLEAEGIQVLLQSRHGLGFVIRAGSMIESYYIQVQKSDESRARELIAVYFAED